MPTQVHQPISGALCLMRARGLDRGHRLAAKLHVSRPTRQLTPEPFPGTALIAMSSKLSRVKNLRQLRVLEGWPPTGQRVLGGSG
jgi:hypothetical protein